MLHFAPLSGPPTLPGHARCAVTTDLRGEWREESQRRGERRAKRGEERGEKGEKVRTEERGEAARLQIDSVSFNRESTGRGLVFACLLVVLCVCFVCCLCLFPRLLCLLCFVLCFFRGGPAPPSRRLIKHHVLPT